MIEIAIGCLFPMLLTAHNLSRVECLEIQNKVNHVSEYTDIVSRYFKEEDIMQALKQLYTEKAVVGQMYGDTIKMVL